MKKPPAFQFYVKDWLSSSTVRQMSMHHRGVYITMLAAMWDSDEPGTLPLPLNIAARSAGVDPRSLADFMAKYPRCLDEVGSMLGRSPVEVSSMSESVPGDIGAKLVNWKLRRQWEELQQYKQELSDAGKRGNEKRWQKSSGGDSGGDSGGNRSASAPASASASAKEKAAPPNDQAKIQGVEPSSAVEKADRPPLQIKENSEEKNLPPPWVNTPLREEIYKGVYRKAVRNRFFDSKNMTLDEQLSDCIECAVTSLSLNRTRRFIEARLDAREVAATALAKLQTGKQTLALLADFERRCELTVAAVVRSVVEAAAELIESRSGRVVPTQCAKGL